MEDMINLSDLLKHEILDLYSAEEQIIEALPGMIEKANNSELKNALREHLAVTKEQKSRLDQIKEWMGENDSKNKGFFSRIFSGSSASEGEKCKGMEGLITEGEKMMDADASEEVCDAAIIASAQKIEHYEISGYGTARTYARELQLNDVADLLERTLNEEYKADDLLTRIAMGRINLEAEVATELDDDKKQPSSRTSAGRKSSNAKTASSNSRTSSQSTRNNGKKSSNEKSTSSSSKNKSSSSNGRSNSSGRNSASNKTASSKSSASAASSKPGGNRQSGNNKKTVKRSSANNKKSARSKSSAARNR